MKPTVLIGLLLAAIGGFILVRGLTYTKDKSVLEVAGLKASVEEKRSIPTWVGIVGVVAGVGLIIVGAGRKNG
ncbi:MAG TPA: hypothetical protein VFU23_04500 [Gemmatimonadales bacterium]|nr:hypothetical protein [Gemmatimonadales bacterium]